MKKRNLLDVEIGALAKLQRSNEKKITRLEKIENSVSDFIQVHLDFGKLLDEYRGKSRSGAEFQQKFEELCKREKSAKANKNKYDKNPEIYDDIMNLKLENANIEARINHKQYFEKRRLG